MLRGLLPLRILKETAGEPHNEPPISTMAFSDEDVQELIQAIEKDKGKHITTDEAREIAGRIFELYLLLAP